MSGYKSLHGSTVCGTAVAVLLCMLFTDAAWGQAPGPRVALESKKPLQEGAANITGILVVPNFIDVNPAGVTGIKGVVVKGPTFLQQADFEGLLSAYLNAPLTQASLDRMQVGIIKYCRARGHLVVDVFFREQDIVENTIQVAIIEGKVGQIAVENEGRKWFSDSLILKNIHLQPGDAVDEGRLNSDLSWLNRNNYQSLTHFDGSFRDVTANFRQGELGKTDVILKVQDRFPLRGFVGYDDSGFTVIGKDHLFAGLTWANVFGIDHRLNYQYVTDFDFNKFRLHAASYVIPLPWRHELTFFGAYGEVRPDFSLLSPTLAGLKGDGSTYQLSGRYSVPLPQARNFDHEISAGFDFKRTDTPLFFGTTAAGLLRTNAVDIAQFTMDYRMHLRDRWGRTALSLQGVYSPGDLTDKNSDPAFNDFSPGADVNYLYGRVELRRETRLPKEFSWYVRGLGQLADSQLVPSETFGLGGYATVRGYDERTVVGDHGWLLVNELRTPWLHLGNLTQRANAVDRVQLLAFCDYGRVITRTTDVALFERNHEVLLSVGGGLRYQMADNLHFRLDYGYQLERRYLTNPGNLESQQRGRVHLGVELSF